MLSAIVLYSVVEKLFISYRLSFLISGILLILEIFFLALGSLVCFRCQSFKQGDSEGFFFKRTIWKRFFLLMYILLGITVSAILIICIIVSTR